MILIADSGSSKTDWIGVDADGKVSAGMQTRGLNPNYISAQGIIRELSQYPGLTGLRPEAIHFYGSGCSSPDTNAIVEAALRHFFPAAKMTILNDLWAAAYACCGREAGIVCILGTGSNSCYFDGRSMQGRNISLGYLLGDEGSGTAICRELLRDCIYGVLPGDLQEAMENTWHPDTDMLVERLYHHPLPNEYIASFLPFVADHIAHPYCNQLVTKNFDAFLTYFVMRFAGRERIAGFEDLPVHFTGSVAYVFRDLLQQCCAAKNLRCGKILRTPINALAAFHAEELKNTDHVS